LIDDELRQRFTAIVDEVRLPIDARCRALLAALIDVGVTRIQHEDAASRVDEAADRLRSLLDDMTQQSRILRFDALHVPNFESALDRRCPMWPFC
jgi:hypothetical protein